MVDTCTWQVFGKFLGHLFIIWGLRMGPQSLQNFMLNTCTAAPYYLSYKLVCVVLMSSVIFVVVR